MIKNKIVITALCVTVSALVLVTTILIVVLTNKSTEQDNQRSQKPTHAQTHKTVSTPDSATPDNVTVDQTQPLSNTEEATQEPTQTNTDAFYNANISAPDSLTYALSLNGNTIDDLSNLSCKQLVTVSSSGSTAKIDFYYLHNNEWKLDNSSSCNGYIGSNGITTDMHEFSYATPKGLYAVSEAFYINSAPNTGLDTFQVTSDTYWVDDPDSAYYNKRIEGTSNKDWDSAEHMIDYTVEYEYGFVINYNPEAKYNAGSAIFFHVGYKSTAGCVATDKSNVLRYLEKLDANQSPYILMV